MSKTYADLTGIAIYHRIGIVPVSEPSVTIVAVSPHRKTAINAASDCIDLLKERVPIWKKEYYKSGETLLD